MDKDELAPITVPCPHNACLTMVIYHKIDELASITVPFPHDRCLTMVAYHKLNDHKTACPYSPCRCTKVGFIFTASPVELLIHLDGYHKVRVHMISYNQSMDFTVTMPLSSFLPSMVIVYCDDASMFSLIIGELGKAAAVSLVCVKAATCSWAWYSVKLCVTRPQSPSDFSMDTDNGAMEPKICTSPHSVVLKDLTFLTLQSRYITAAAGQYQKVFSFSVCIDKKN